MDSSKFEDIIKSKFDGVQSELPSGAWNAVQSQIGSGASGFAGLSGIAKIAIAAASLSAIIISSTLFFDADEKTPVQSEQTVDEVAEVEENQEQTTIEEKPNLKESSSSTFKNPGEVEPIKHSSKGLEENEVEKDIIAESEHINKDEVEVINSTTNLVKSESSKVNHEDADNQEEHSADEQTVPNKITKTAVHGKLNTFEFGLSPQPSEGLDVVWYVDEEKRNDGNTQTTEILSNGSLIIMARISKDGQVVKELFLEEDFYLEPELSMFNVFSPNGDNWNDEYGIDFDKSENIHWFEFTIKDKFGNQVFQSNDNQTTWDGNLTNGDPAAVGEYYYFVFFKSEFGAVKSRNGKFKLTR